MRSDELDYVLPPELIAQHPADRRDASRLLVYDRVTGAVRHRTFSDLPSELAGELVVVNDTRVVPARLHLQRESGGAAEVLLLEPLGAVELLESLGEGRWRVRLDGEPEGEPPLPPYIHEPLAEPERYQTVYAADPGSAAAPTAGLHFTPELLAQLDVEHVTLHVGLDTFRPLAVAELEEHE